jgi:GT2 family glycosyltransferase
MQRLCVTGVWAMSDVCIGVVAYTLAEDLLRLYETGHGPGVDWLFMAHSEQPDVIDALRSLEQHDDVRVIYYGRNRGLARSWNDALIFMRALEYDTWMIANDDAQFSHGDVLKMAAAARRHPECGFIMGAGHEVRSGLVLDAMGFTLAAINPVALDTIGFFDENFWPIYYEDMDWRRRLDLAGVPVLKVAGVDLLHYGSKSLDKADMNLHHQRFIANRAYYVSKWGGDVDHEVYVHPFNDPAISLYIDQIDRWHPHGRRNRLSSEESEQSL